MLLLCLNESVAGRHNLPRYLNTTPALILLTSRYRRFLCLLPGAKRDVYISGCCSSTASTHTILATMATDFSTATVVSQPALYQHNAYKTSTNYTPMGSGSNTPLNSSPTSPRNNGNPALYGNHAPQIRPQKVPIYVPAALRKTEKPARQSPPRDDFPANSPESSWGPGSGFGQVAGDGAQSPVLRIATEDLHSIYNDTPLSPIAGPITKNHWQVC